MLSTKELLFYYFIILDKCAKSSSHDAENCNCRNIGWCEGGSKDNFLEERRGTSEECAMGGLLLSQLHTVMQATSSPLLFPARLII